MCRRAVVLCVQQCAQTGPAQAKGLLQSFHRRPPAPCAPYFFLPIPFLFLLSSSLLLPCSVCMRSPSSYCLGFWLFIRWHTAKSPCTLGFLNCDLIFLYFHSSPLLSSKLIQIFPCLSRQSFHPWHPKIFNCTCPFFFTFFNHFLLWTLTQPANIFNGEKSVTSDTVD